MIKSGGRFKLYLLFVLLVYFVLHTSLSEACRFWVAVGEEVPRDYIINQLIDEENSLKRLGSVYADGWSIGYYDDGEEIVIRGDEASNYNEEYDEAVRYVANFQPQITMGHLRRASSGCVDGVPNPHPFRITYNNIDWLFGHNGGIKKELLIKLIGKKYLKKYPPSVCTDNPPESWIDSELYFIFLMKTIEEHNDHVEKGLMAALSRLYQAIDEDQRYLNFFLTNGERVWSFRKGTSLFFKIDKQNKINTISSTVPEAEQGDWQIFPEDTLATIHLNKPMEFYYLK